MVCGGWTNKGQYNGFASVSPVSIQWGHRVIHANYTMEQRIRRRCLWTLHKRATIRLKQPCRRRDHIRDLLRRTQRSTGSRSTLLLEHEHLQRRRMGICLIKLELHNRECNPCASVSPVSIQWGHRVIHANYTMEQRIRRRCLWTLHKRATIRLKQPCRRRDHIRDLLRRTQRSTGSRSTLLLEHEHLQRRRMGICLIKLELHNRKCFEFLC